MASTLVSTLYPPQVDTFMPAFVYTDDAAVVKFSISPYNTKDKIKYIHISVVDQTNNQSVLQPSEIVNGGLSSGIVLDDVYIIPFLAEDSSNGVYQVSIPKERLKEIAIGDDRTVQSFKPGQFYKVQLRFDGSTNVNANQTFSTDYLIQNRQYFSEWSSVCLIRPIYRPVLSLSRFTNPQKPVLFNQGIIPVVGSVLFDNSDSPFKETTSDNTFIDQYERLQSYSFQLLTKDGNKIAETGTLYPTLGSNTINCALDGENTQQGNEYVLKAFITTKNQYVLEEEYLIKIEDFNGDYTFNPAIELFENIEDGFVTIKVQNGDPEPGKDWAPGGKLYIKRASSIDNFKTWELLAVSEEESANRLSTTFVDRTVASMVRYKYRVQYQYVTSAEGVKVGTWSQSKTTREIYPTFYDMMLSRGDKQLAIRYNGQVSSMKPVVSRTKFDTLGSKYPRFAENALMNYKQYSITGLISAEGDFNRTFMSEFDKKYIESIKAYDEAFGGSYMVRNDALPGEVVEDVDIPGRVDSLKNTTHDVYPHNNWYWEREFREEAIKWLNDGEPKLFRSMPEGNMAVMLTDVNLTPNQNMGRMLYTFNATMYEIEDGYSLESLDKAGIIDVPNLDDVDILTSDAMINNFDNNTGVYSRDVVNICQLEINKNNNDYESITSMLANKLAATYTGVREHLLPSFEDLVISNVQIQFTSVPSYYSQDLITEGSDLFGYVVQYGVKNMIGSQPFFIGSQGYYQFSPEQEFTFFKLQNKEDSAIITCTYKYKEGTSAKNTPTQSFIQEKTIGQLSGLFECDEWLVANIKNKYNMEINKISHDTHTLQSKQWLASLNGLSFDVTPYAAIELLFEGDTSFTPVTIGRSGVYNIDKECNITNLRFVGRKMFKGEPGTEHLNPWEFKEGGQGERNSVYAANGDYVISFNGQEYPFYYLDETYETGLAKIPVEGYITYFGDIARSDYQ